MPSDDLVKYFIEHTNERFDQIEKKVDKLITFRLVLLGSAIGISGLISVLFQVVMAIAGGK